MLNVTFRVDASVEIGSGHVMRCLTLATAMQDVANCQFICQASEGHMAAVIVQHGFAVSLFEYAADDWEQDAHLTAALLQDCDLLIIDHYLRDFSYEQRLRQFCRYIMVIDDLANRAHDCDVLLDCNLLPHYQQRYSSLVPENCQTLLGPFYALLRNEFSVPQTEERRPDHLLICFGGTDPANMTQWAIDALRSAKVPAHTADVVVGASHPHITAITESVACLPEYQLHVQANNMAMLMQRASLMVGAGGSMHWERCRMGLPAAVVTLADNQVETTRYLQELHVCVWLGTARELNTVDSLNKIISLLTQPSQLEKMSENASMLVPAEGGANAVKNALLSVVRGKNATL
ncbi:MAG: UDP-2,4-diacetamido-2,4,6-trideoxy-beta-L-altropyranose hydrolase [Pseudomonadota bacterium]|nr:UDP-2,4-diacetamido-2,4,6-trideoxy-beta-L-altropyranose hydrolase [Pseudomonadota bacterium]